MPTPVRWLTRGMQYLGALAAAARHSPHNLLTISSAPLPDAHAPLSISICLNAPEGHRRGAYTAHTNGTASHEAPARAYTHKHTHKHTQTHTNTHGIYPLRRAEHTRHSTPLGGRSKEACGEYLFKGLYRAEYRGGDGGGGFHLLDQACTVRTYEPTCSPAHSLTSY